MGIGVWLISVVVILILVIYGVWLGICGVSGLICGYGFAVAMTADGCGGARWQVLWWCKVADGCGCGCGRWQVVVVMMVLETVLIVCFNCGNDGGWWFDWWPVV